MKDFSEMTQEEVFAYWHHKGRYGEVPKTNEELELAVLADRTFRQLYIISCGQVIWDKKEQRYVCF